MAARKRTKQQRTEDLVRLAEAIATFPPYKKQRELAELFGVSQQQISHDRAALRPFFDQCRDCWRKGVSVRDAYQQAAQDARRHFLGDAG